MLAAVAEEETGAGRRCVAGCMARQRSGGVQRAAGRRRSKVAELVWSQFFLRPPSRPHHVTARSCEMAQGGEASR